MLQMISAVVTRSGTPKSHSSKTREHANDLQKTSAWRLWDYRAKRVWASRSWITWAKAAARSSFSCQAFSIFSDASEKHRQLIKTNTILLSAIKILTYVNVPRLRVRHGTTNSCQSTLTYAVVHLIAVFLQVVLDAALEEVQFGFELLGEAEHAVFTPRQVGVVAQETQPGERGESLFTSMSDKTLFRRGPH